MLRTFKKKIGLYEIAEDSFLLVVGFYLLFLVSKTTTFKLEFSWNVGKYVLKTLYLLTFLKVLAYAWTYRDRLLNDSKYRNKAIVLAVSASAVAFTYYIVFRSDNYIFLKHLGVITFGMIGTDYKKAVKLYVCLVGLMVAASIIAAWSGIIPNLVYNRGDGTLRSSWGIGYPTDYASYILFLCIMAWIAWDEVNDWIFFICAVVSLLNSYVVARSNTSTICDLVLMLTIIIHWYIYGQKKRNRDSVDMSAWSGDGVEEIANAFVQSRHGTGESTNSKRSFGFFESIKQFLEKSIRHISGLAVQSAFLFFSAITFVFVYIYSKQLSIGYKLDNLMHGRISLGYKAYVEHGLSLFGVPFDQHGAGGSTFSNAEYNFIDSTYMLILLRYGVVLFVIIALMWVLMTRRAIKIGDMRLALGMAVIAFHSFSEHHFIELNYNILLVLPFSVLGAGWLMESQNQTRRAGSYIENQNDAYQGVIDSYGKGLMSASLATNTINSKLLSGILTAALFIGGGLVGGPYFLSWLRTLWDVTEDIDIRGKKKLVLAGLMLFIAMLIIMARALYVLLKGIMLKYPEAAGTELTDTDADTNTNTNTVVNIASDIEMVSDEKPDVEKTVDNAYGISAENKYSIKNNCIVFLSLVAVFVLLIMGGTFVIYSQSSDYNQTLEAERAAIEAVKNANTETGGVFQATELPLLYQKKFGGLTYSFFSGDELAVCDDMTVLTDSEYESACFIGMGFLYSEISDEHALYTNDRAVMKELRQAGYHLTGYFSKELVVDMDYIADINHLDRSEDGALIVDGEEASLIYGPYYDIRGGKLTTTFELQLPQELIGMEYGEDYKLGTLRVSSRWGNNIIKEVGVYRSQFDNRGRLTVEIPYSISDSRGMEFLLFMEAGRSLEVLGITCCKTPDMDVHTSYDHQGHKIREEFYDLDGQPAERKEGFYAAEYEYNDEDLLSLVRYFDANGNSVIISSGYAAISKDYDIRKRVIREAYYNEAGDKLALENGAAAVEYEYDESGNRIEYRYFDVGNDPVVIDKGYSILRRRFNDNKKVIWEAYYDTGGKLMMLPSGYAMIERDYDEAENEARVSFYGTDEKLIMVSDGYAEVRRTYDEDKRITREEYYGTDGNLMKFKSEYAIVDYEYDIYGNKSVYRYYGTDGKPIIVSGGYSKLLRTYDSSGRLLREEYYGIDNKPTIGTTGFAAIERRYDENGNEIYTCFYDTSGKRIVGKDGYAERHRKFDSEGNVVRDEFYGASGELQVLQPGQAIATYKCDENGNRVDTFYYGIDEQPVLVWNSYHGVHQEYNDDNQVVLEYYYGLEGEIIARKEGYYILGREYDDEGNIVVMRYLDQDRKPVLRTEGYAEVRRTFNDKKQIIKELYCDTEGKPVNINAGYAIVEYRYDVLGNQTDVAYYDVDEKPVLWRGHFYKAHREYDDKKQVVREEYLDETGKLMMRDDGFAITERKYDTVGNMTEQRYLDAEGKLVINSSGYAILRREYDEAKRIIKESYYDTEEKLVESIDGYAVVNNIYDNNGDRISRVQYDRNGEQINNY